MRIAIATDQDSVASGFGCCPFCTIVDLEGGEVRHSLLIPNPGAQHLFWADLFFRNSIQYVIAGSMGPTARSTFIGRGIQPVLGAKGLIDDVIRRFAAGELAAGQQDESRGEAVAAGCDCSC